MFKDEIVKGIANITKLQVKDAGAALDAFTEVVIKALKKGEEVKLVGFGTFKVAKAAAREGRNPKTGATIKIPARKLPKFSAGAKLKDAVA